MSNLTSDYWNPNCYLIIRQTYVSYNDWLLIDVDVDWR